MTNILCENDRWEYTIMIDGHSGHNPGNDIVCASCSTLAYTLINSLANTTTDKFNVEEYEEGFVLCVKGTHDSWNIVKTIIETIMLGYEMLQERYPANVSVIW